MKQKLKLRGKDLIELGYPEGPVVGTAISVMHRYYKRESREAALAVLRAVLEEPTTFAEHQHLDPIVRKLASEDPKEQVIELKSTVEDYTKYGLVDIDEAAIGQMDTAMRLPVAKAGALMPDAHLGYGLPIGGVLAVENAVIPYGVGMDIGCRMCLSIYAVPPQSLEEKPQQFEKLLLEHSRFGHTAFERPKDHEVLHRTEFREISKAKELWEKARKQIGTSGSGNHFVEFGLVGITETDPSLNLAAGTYLALLSHSGSRGFGAGLAEHFTKLAMERCRLPQEARHLAWLSLDTQEGMEYWLAMNLAGDYASACHHQIHDRIADALGEQPLAVVENHHNFAWKETLADGKEYIVHRKGATPAGKGVLGVIPGSMTAPAFIVKGKGEPQALQSAAHGAGRRMSRRKAKQQFDRKALEKHLKDHGVRLIGAGLDEAPFAYKDIHQVMKRQKDLVEVLGTFYPKVVRMDQ